MVLTFLIPDETGLEITRAVLPKHVGMFRRFPARQTAVGKGERPKWPYALRGEACATLGDGGSGCRNPGSRTRRVCAGEGKFVGTRGRESVNSVRRGVLQVQRAALSCIRFVRLHGPAAARGLVAGEAFSPGVCGKEEGVPLRR